VNLSVNIVLIGTQHIDTLKDGVPLQRTPIATCFYGIRFFVQDSPLTRLIQNIPLGTVRLCVISVENTTVMTVGMEWGSKEVLHSWLAELRHDLVCLISIQTEVNWSHPFKFCMGN